MQPNKDNSIVIGSLEDLFTSCYPIIDDLYRKLAPPQISNRPGPAPSLSDSEVITISIVGELFGMDVEARWYSLVCQQFGDMFPDLVERSRFNRRRRDLWQLTNLLRDHLVRTLEVPGDPYRIIDSFPVVVANWSRRSRLRLGRGEGGFGKSPAKQMRFFGYKLHLLINMDGMITNFVMAPANAYDGTLAPQVLEGYYGLVVLGDGAYGGLALETEMKEHHITMLGLRRKDSTRPLPKALTGMIRSRRQLVETVGSQLSVVFHIERNWAKSVWGLKTRIVDKLFAHSIGFYLNSLMGRPPLHMASLIY